MTTEYAKAKARQRAQTAYYRKKKQVMDHYGGAQCVECDEDDFHLLQLHHTNHNGATCRREACVTTSSYTYWNWLIKNNYPPHHKQRVLCRNCHVKITLATIDCGPVAILKPREYASLINPHDIPLKRQIQYAKYIREGDPGFTPQHPEVIQRLRKRIVKEGKYAPYWFIESLRKSGYNVKGLYKPKEGSEPLIETLRKSGYDGDKLYELLVGGKRTRMPRKSRKPKRVRQHKHVALTDKDKLLSMFGFTKEDIL